MAITWPTAADLAINRRLHWGAHVPARVRRWAYLIVPDAAAAGVDSYLVAAVMQIESLGDPLAWNLDSDARGLMQVLHASFEPAINVRVGVGMLGALQQQFGRRRSRKTRQAIESLAEHQIGHAERSRERTVVAVE